MEVNTDLQMERIPMNFPFLTLDVQKLPKTKFSERCINFAVFSFVNHSGVVDFFFLVDGGMDGQMGQLPGCNQKTDFNIIMEMTATC